MICGNSNEDILSLTQQPVGFCLLTTWLRWTSPVPLFSFVWADPICAGYSGSVPFLVLTSGFLWLSALLLPCSFSCVALTDVRIFSICSWSFICCCCAAFSRSTRAPPATDALRAAFSPADAGACSAEGVKHGMCAIICEDYTPARCWLLVQCEILVYLAPAARRCRFSSPPQLSRSLCPPAGTPGPSACGSAGGRTRSRCIFLRPGWRCRYPSTWCWTPGVWAHTQREHLRFPVLWPPRFLQQIPHWTLWKQG